MRSTTCYTLQQWKKGPNLELGAEEEALGQHLKVAGTVAEALHNHRGELGDCYCCRGAHGAIKEEGLELAVTAIVEEPESTEYNDRGS